jgi:hypothetical protein
MDQISGAGQSDIGSQQRRDKGGQVNAGEEIEGRSAEEFMETMIRLRREDWTGLYLDAAMGQLWKLSYPWSSSHGGGSPHLRPDLG